MKNLMVFLALCSLLFAGCTNTEKKDDAIGMPNPAAVYCKEKGYEYRIVEGKDGQRGECLAEGRWTDEWTLYRNAHATATTEPVIGGDVDEHGCLVSAGYSWNESVKACIREWELNADQKKAAGIAVEYINPTKGVTVKSVDVMRCPGCFRVNLILGLNSGDREVSVSIDDWKAGEEKHVCTPEEKAAEACTLEYMPVCGSDGKTYGNKCGACAAEGVEYYTRGECAVPQGGDQMLSHQWKLTQMNGRTVNDSSAGLEFDQDAKMIGGSGGCNRLSGSYKIDGDKISFGQIGTTKMYCEGVMELESEYTDLLSGRTYRWEVTGHTLSLYSGDKAVLVFEMTEEKNVR